MRETNLSASGEDIGFSADMAVPGVVVVLLHLTVVWFLPMWYHLSPLEWPLTVQTLREQPAAPAMLEISLRLPALLILAWGAHRFSVFRGALSGNASTFVAALVFSGIAAIALGFTGLWPWPWTFPESPGVVYTHVLLEENAWTALVGGALRTGLIDPFIEEVIFRFGFLRLLLQWSSSKQLAVIGSAGLFAGAHLLPVVAISTYLLLHIIWLFGLGLFLGWLTLRQDGRILIPWAIHCGINLASVGSLVFAVALVN